MQICRNAKLSIGMLSRIKKRWFCTSSSDAKQESRSTNRTADDDDDQVQLKRKILKASLPFISEYGWTTTTISNGAESINYPSVLHGLFDDVPSVLVLFLYKHLNAQLVKHLEQNPRGHAKVGDFVSDKLRTRLEYVTPYINRWPEAMGILAKPANAPKALRLLLEISDDIWFHAGDRSHDFSWYTKRVSTMAVYSSAQLHMLQDKSPEFEDTWTFMKRRLIDVRSVGTSLSQVQDGSVLLANLGYSAFHTVRNVFGMNSSQR